MENGKAVILIVDDKPANILVLETLLGSPDRTLLSAHSGSEALKMALEEDVDLIILDVQMPDIDGFEVAQLLKQKKRTRDIPIIFATAESKEHSFVMQGYSEGAIDYLFKPLDPDIARAKVAVLLKIQMQQKELREKNISLQNAALLINNSADIIGIVDAGSFLIEEINPAFEAILGFSYQEAIGKSVFYFLQPEDETRIKEMAAAQKDRLSFETYTLCKDQSWKWLHWNIVAGKEKWFVNTRDITEQKFAEKRKLEQERAEQSLKQHKLITEVTIQAQEKERTELGRELHDNINQILATVRMYLKMSLTTPSKQEELVRRSADNLDHAIEEIRKLSKSLVAPSLGDMGLLVALKELAEEINIAGDLKVAVLTEINESIKIDKNMEVMLYRIAQEQLNNIRKYASATHAVISLSMDRHHLSFSIADDGVGFDTKQKAKGIGLKNISSRVDFYSGDISINSEPGKGCELEISIPLH
ncbi:MAG: response regulator [Chitinophagaceae bacterium]|nr:response regulator [Chitinophagaceae bacterium]